MKKEDKYRVEEDIDDVVDDGNEGRRRGWKGNWTTQKVNGQIFGI